MHQVRNLLLISLLVICHAVNGQIINRFAGDYVNGYSGDNGPATAASLYHPAGIFADQSGNVYITDFGNYVIRKVNASGTINTIAGTGTAGYSGDGGAATAAEMHPTGVSADNLGNVYIADAFNNVIRKIDPTGTITTIAGATTAGYSGDGGPATAAKFDDPNEVRTDRSGNLYIADSHNNVIRKINTSGIISTIAGNGYNAGTGNGGYAGDGGPATGAELYYPEDVAIDNAGNVGAHYMRTVQFDNKKAAAAKLAKVAGCSPEEVIITRNTTESRVQVESKPRAIINLF